MVGRKSQSTAFADASHAAAAAAAAASDAVMRQRTSGDRDVISHVDRARRPFFTNAPREGKVDAFKRRQSLSLLCYRH